jgi:hypothetical protein
MRKNSLGMDPESYAMTGQRAAPAGKFRLLVADTFDGSDAALDFSEKRDAVHFAKSKAGKGMLRLYVYDDSGELVFSC